MAHPSSQPQRAVGRARCVLDREHGRVVVRVMLERGDEVGFAIGAMHADGFRITSAEPRALTVLVGRRRLRTVAKALRAVGFTVNEGAAR